MTFTAKVEGVELDKIKFEWTPFVGTIASGQGTSTIVVPIDADMAGQTITVTVEISGLPENCPKEASGAGEVVPRVPVGIFYRDIDDYGRVSWRDEKEKLKMVANEIHYDSDTMAIFIFSKSSNENLKNFKIRLTRIGKYLSETLNIDKDRIRFRFNNNNSDYNTKILLFPMSEFSEATTWEQDIERILPPKNTPKKKSQPKRK